MKKKLISILLVICFSILPMQNISANSINQSASSANASIEEILSSYHVQTQNLKLKSSDSRSRTLQSEYNLIQEETVNALNEVGYEAYNINSGTFDETQTVLSTDLHSLGLDSNYSYIAVISGESSSGSSNIIAPYGAGSTFNYTYNGTTYKMRYFTITAADDPAYGKASSVNVLNSSTQTLIKNCLDTAISTYISSISVAAATIASICGLSVSNFSTAGTATLYMHGGTNWTREYIQVWSDYDNMWLFGSCVEYVETSMYMSGQYYSASQNRYLQVPKNEKCSKKYSGNYYNSTWRKDKAVYGYANLWIQHDTRVGDIEYKYGGSTKITHKESF